jgi:tight adherence protein C
MVGMDKVILGLAFLSATSVAFGALLLLGGYNRRVAERLRKLPSPGSPAAKKRPLREFTRSALVRIGTPLLPSDESERSRMKTQQIHAGLYSRDALAVFLGVKLFLIVLPLLAALSVVLLHLLPLQKGLTFGLAGSVFGIMAANFWLESKKNRRQCDLRRALPDALDVMVICMEGGLSLVGAFRRVIAELGMAHPVLTAEMSTVQREIQLGLSAGEALRKFADRCGLEETRSLASVVLQAERFGASMVKMLRVHADMLRLRRLQRSEEMAQKASVKILFPTLVCIFPAIMFVYLGPAAIQIKNLFTRLH